MLHEPQGGTGSSAMENIRQRLIPHVAGCAIKAIVSMHKRQIRCQTFSLWIQHSETFKTSVSHSLEAFAHGLSMNQISLNVKPHLQHNIQWMTWAWLATCPVLSVSIRCVCCWFKRVVCTLAYLNSLHHSKSLHLLIFFIHMLPIHHLPGLLSPWITTL